MITLDRPVIVEGKYDKIKLKSIIDSAVIETGGFNIFKDKQKLNMIKRLAEKTGIIIMTDSDAAGFKIRSYLKSAIPADKIINVYIPDIFGKEKRKSAPSAEGKLGVEGLKTQIIINALQRAGAIREKSDENAGVTMTDFYEDGLSGCKDSAVLRDKLKAELHLPQRLSSKLLLEVINTLISYDEYKKIVEKCKKLDNE